MRPLKLCNNNSMVVTCSQAVSPVVVLLVEVSAVVEVVTSLRLRVVMKLSEPEVVGVMSLKLISPRWTQLSGESLGKVNSIK